MIYARDIVSERILVNTVCPGFVATDLSHCTLVPLQKGPFRRYHGHHPRRRTNRHLHRRHRPRHVATPYEGVNVSEFCTARRFRRPD